MSGGRRRPPRYPGSPRGGGTPKPPKGYAEEAILSEDEVERRINVEGGGQLQPPPAEHAFRDRRPSPPVRALGKGPGLESVLLLGGLIIAGLVAVGILLPDGPLTASSTNPPSAEATTAAVAPTDPPSIGPVNTGGLITLPPGPSADATPVPASEAPVDTPAATPRPEATPRVTPRPTPKPTPEPTPKPTSTPDPTSTPPTTATLVVIVSVTNDGGGRAGDSEWTVTVDSDGTATPSSFAGTIDGTLVILSANGAYAVTAEGPSGYRSTASADCSSSTGGLPAPGSSRTCKLTMNDTRPTLNVVTIVDNAAGGTQTPADWTVTVSGTDVSPGSFPGSEAGVAVRLDADAPFDVAMANPNDAGYSLVESGTCDGSGLALAEIVTCTFTYTFVPPAPALGAVLPLLALGLPAIGAGIPGRRRWTTPRA